MIKTPASKAHSDDATLAALNLKDPRLSNHLDIQHATRDAVKSAYSLDQKTLSAAGCTVTQTEWSRPEKGFVQAIVTRQNEKTLIDWTQDSAWRSFPAVRDEEVGWRLAKDHAKWPISAIE